MNRKRVLLFALLALLVLSIVYAYLTMPRLEKAPPRVASERGKPAASSAVSRSANADSRIRFAEAESLKFNGAKRDIFRFKQRYQSPVFVSPAKAAVPVVTPAGPAPEAVSFATVQAELSRFTFIGFLDKAGEKSVFLTSGGTLFIAKRGEAFGLDREFLVAAIDGNLLKVKRSGLDSLVEIPLIEKQKLSASVSAPARLAPLGGQEGALSPRSFTPRSRAGKPPVAEGTENYEPVVPEESIPTEQQEQTPPAEGTVIEGEGNGKKQ